MFVSFESETHEKWTVSESQIKIPGRDIIPLSMISGLGMAVPASENELGAIVVQTKLGQEKKLFFSKNEQEEAEKAFYFVKSKTGAEIISVSNAVTDEEKKEQAEKTQTQKARAGYAPPVNGTRSNRTKDNANANSNTNASYQDQAPRYSAPSNTMTTQLVTTAKKIEAFGEVIYIITIIAAFIELIAGIITIANVRDGEELILPFALSFVGIWIGALIVRFVYKSIALHFYSQAEILQNTYELKLKSYKN